MVRVEHHASPMSERCANGAYTFAMRHRRPAASGRSWDSLRPAADGGWLHSACHCGGHDSSRPARPPDTPVRARTVGSGRLDVEGPGDPIELRAPESGLPEVSGEMGTDVRRRVVVCWLNVDRAATVRVFVASAVGTGGVARSRPHLGGRVSGDVICTGEYQKVRLTHDSLARSRPCPC